MKWILTYSKKGPGDPDGYFCPQCFSEVIYDGEDNWEPIDPKEASKYKCDLCNKDYRDEKKSS